MCSCVSELLGTESETCLQPCLRSLELYGDQALRTIVPFATAHLEIFHYTHHPVIHFYFLLYLKFIVYKNIKVTVYGLINGFGKLNEPQHTCKWILSGQELFNLNNSP